MKYKRTNVLHIANCVGQNAQKKKLLHSYSNLLLTFSGGQDSAFCLLIVYLLQNRIRLKWNFKYMNQAHVRQRIWLQKYWPEQRFCESFFVHNYLSNRAMVIAPNTIQLPFLASIKVRPTTKPFFKKRLAKFTFSTQISLRQYRFVPTMKFCSRITIECHRKQTNKNGIKQKLRSIPASRFNTKQIEVKQVDFVMKQFLHKHLSKNLYTSLQSLSPSE